MRILSFDAKGYYHFDTSSKDSWYLTLEFQIYLGSQERELCSRENCIVDYTS